MDGFEATHILDVVGAHDADGFFHVFEAAGESRGAGRVHDVEVRQLEVEGLIAEVPLDERQVELVAVEGDDEAVGLDRLAEGIEAVVAGLGLAANEDPRAGAVGEADDGDLIVAWSQTGGFNVDESDVFAGRVTLPEPPGLFEGPVGFVPGGIARGGRSVGGIDQLDQFACAADAEQRGDLVLMGAGELPARDALGPQGAFLFGIEAFDEAERTGEHPLIISRRRRRQGLQRRGR